VLTGQSGLNASSWPETKEKEELGILKKKKTRGLKPEESRPISKKNYKRYDSKKTN